MSTIPPEQNTSVYVPTDEESQARTTVMDVYIANKNVTQRSYPQFNGRNIYEAIDDWTKRWNGYIPAMNPLLDVDQSRIFLNFTRNIVIAYLAKVAQQPPKANIVAVNNKTGIGNKQFAQVLKDMVQYSDNAENAPARFMETAMEATVKGTAIVYEGYARNTQKTKIPESFDMETGKGKFKTGEKVIFDNVFRKLIPLEDFYISNAYQPNIQMQPRVLWRSVTTYYEASSEYGHYSNWKYVKPGAYTLSADPTTFYQNRKGVELGKDQVQVLRYYNKKDNEHIVMINGVIIYDGPIPFKDGNYPFARYIFEPYDNFFFWGMGYPQKIMGEQDLQNTFINMMADKTFGSLLPFGMSSDLDDIVEDEFLAPNKIRKVSDVNKWKFETLPGVSAGEEQMLQTVLKLGKDNSGLEGGGGASTPRGGKLPVRQVLLQQQESMTKIGFTASNLEDGEVERVRIRIPHILQFYSIPKIEKITGKNGKEMEQLTYRDIKLSGVMLSDNKKGNKIIKLVEPPANKDAEMKLANELSVTEAMGEETGIPTEAIAVNVDTLYDYNYDVQVVKNSSYERNAILDQAARQEYANWRMQMMQFAPLDANELVNWVSEAYDIDTDRFAPKQPMQMPQQPGQQPETPMPAGGANPTKQLSPQGMGALTKLA